MRLVAEAAGGDDEGGISAFWVALRQEVIPGEVQPIRPDRAIETAVAAGVAVALQDSMGVAA